MDAEKKSSVVFQDLMRSGKSSAEALADPMYLAASEDVKELERDVAEARRAYKDIKGRPSVPPMPFFKNYDELSIKKSILTAANEGYDRIVIASGAQTAGLYDLSKQVKLIEWTAKKDGTKNVSITPIEGNQVEFIVTPEGNTLASSGRVTSDWYAGKRLDEVIGKDAAEKVLDSNNGDLSGDGLKIGGAWATNLYDKRIPSILKDLIRKNKWNTALEEIDIGAENGPNVSMRITPEMAESVRAEGLPLFERAKPYSPEDTKIIFGSQEAVNEAAEAIQLDLFDTGEAARGIDTRREALLPAPDRGVPVRRPAEGVRGREPGKLDDGGGRRGVRIAGLDPGKSKVEVDWGAKKRVDYRGIKGNLVDMAQAFSVYRSPHMETTQEIFGTGTLDEGTVAAHNIISSGLSNQADIDEFPGDPARSIYAVQDRLRRSGADWYIEGHNHPGGNTMPSQADLAQNQRHARKNPDTYKGMLIFNGDKFRFIAPDGTQTEFDYVPQNAYDMTKGTQISGAKDIAGLVAPALKAGAKSVFVALGNNLDVMAWYPSGASTLRPDVFYQRVQESGALQGIVVTNDEAAYDLAKNAFKNQSGRPEDVLLDVVYVGDDNSVRSPRTEPGMRPQAEEAIGGRVAQRKARRGLAEPGAEYKTPKGAIEKTTGVKKSYSFLGSKYGIEDVERKVKELDRVLGKIRSRRVREERGQVGVAFDIATQQREEIAKLQTEAQRTAATDIMLGEMRRMVRRYAAEIGYRGPITATAMEDAKTLSSLERSLKRLDRVMERQNRSKALGRVRQVIDGYRKRIARWESGKGKPTIPNDHIMALREYIGMVDEDRGGYDIESINERLMKINQGQGKGEDVSHKERRLKELYDKVLGGADPESMETTLDLSDKIFLANALRPPLSAMDSKGLEGVLADIKSIYKHGKTLKEREIRRAEKVSGVRARAAAAQIRATTPAVEHKHPFVAAVAETDARRAGKKLWQTISEIGASMGWGYIRPELIAETFTDNYQMLGDRPGAISRYAFDPVLEGHTKELQGRAEAIEWLEENFKDIPRTAIDQPAMTVSYVSAVDADGNVTERGEQEITLGDALYIYANSFNPNNFNHLLGTGSDEVTAFEVQSQLPEEYRHAVDRLIDHYDEHQYSRLNEAFRGTYGVDMPKEDRYFPILRLARKNAESGVIADLLQRHSTARPATVSKGFVKKRVGSGAAFKDFDFFGTVYQNMGAVEHFIAMEEPINATRRFLGNEDVKQAMIDKSPEAYRQMQRWLKDAAAGKIADVPQNWLDQWADYARKNYSVFALGLNPRVWLKQPVSLLISMAHSKDPAAALAAFVKSVHETVTHPVQGSPMAKTVKAMSPYMAARPGTLEREIQEFTRKAEFNKLFGTGVKADQLRTMAMKMIQVFDEVTTTAAWMDKYNATFAKRGSHRASVDAADMLVRRTQPEGAVANLPQMFRQRGVVGAYTAFQNQINQHANQMYMMYRAAKSEKTDKAEVAGVSTKVLAALMAGAVAMYLIDNGMNAKRMLREPEELAKNFVMGAGVGTFAIANQLISDGLDAVINEGRDRAGKPRKRRYGSNYAPPIFSSIERTATSVDGFVKLAGSLADGDFHAAGKHGKKAVENAMEAGAATTGLPLSFPLRLAKGAKNVSDYGPAALLWSQSVLTSGDQGKATLAGLRSNNPLRAARSVNWVRGQSAETLRALGEREGVNVRAEMTRARDRLMTGRERTMRQMRGERDPEKRRQLERRLKEISTALGMIK